MKLCIFLVVLCELLLLLFVVIILSPCFPAVLLVFERKGLLSDQAFLIHHSATNTPTMQHKISTTTFCIIVVAIIIITTTSTIIIMITIAIIQSVLYLQVNCFEASIFRYCLSIVL